MTVISHLLTVPIYQLRRVVASYPMPAGPLHGRIFNPPMSLMGQQRS
jgi:hypothetical protein